MRINNLGVQSTFINLHSVNRTANQNTTQKSEQQDQSYTVSISSSGKASSLIDNLMKQRQNITDSKNNLVSRTLKDGGSMESIQSQLDSYDKQINDINMQIVQLTAQFSKDKTHKSDSSVNSEPKTDNQIQTERAGSLIKLSTNLGQLQTVSSAKTKIDGEAGSLQSEIRIDESRGVASSSKVEGLADLQSKSASLSARISEDLGNINDDIKAGNSIQAVKHEHSEKDKSDETNIGVTQKTESNNVISGLDVNNSANTKQAE
jgi:hypothetical protein